MLELAKQNQLFLGHLLDRNPALSALPSKGLDSLGGVVSSNEETFGEVTVDDWLRSENRIFASSALPI